MTNIRLLAIALMVAGATAGCEQKSVETNVQNLLAFGNPPPAEPQEPTPPLQAANPPLVNDPVPVVNEYDRWANEPGYVCEPVFRQISCLDDGRPVYLDSNMNQLPFGEAP